MNYAIYALETNDDPDVIAFGTYQDMHTTLVGFAGRMCAIALVEWFGADNVVLHGNSFSRSYVITEVTNE